MSLTKQNYQFFQLKPSQYSLIIPVKQINIKNNISQDNCFSKHCLIKVSLKKKFNYFLIS